MTSVPLAQARLLSHRGVQSSYFDSLTVDGFFSRLPIYEIEGDSISWPIIQNSDKPMSIGYVSSGGTMSTSPVGYGASVTVQLKRIAAQVQVAKDLVANVSDIHPVAEDQALAIAALVQEEVCKQLWTVSQSADAPPGMVSFASQNPNGVASPAAGVGTPLTIHDLRCMRAKGGPWLPSSPLCYVMHPKLYFQLHDLAQSYGSPLEYMVDPATGERGPRLDNVPVVACGHIALDEGSGNTSAYLVLVGEGEKDPQKIAGLTRVHPKGRFEVEVGPFHPDSDSDDIWISEIGMDIAFAARSRTSVVRLSGVKYL